MAAGEMFHSVRGVLGAAADRLGVAPTAIVAVMMALVAAAFGGWWALKAPDPPVAESVIPSIFQSPIPVPVPTVTSSPDSKVLIDVGGAVVDPGVHEIREGDRVVDAIRAAGGLRHDADRSRLNFAMPILDGQRLWVPTIGDQEPTLVSPEGGVGTAQAGSPAPSINLNDADSRELESLPGIGPSLAAAIISFRTREGPFLRVDDLTKVPGIGQVKLQQFRDLVSV